MAQGRITVSDIACSVIVPVRNEAGNIANVLDTVPILWGPTEIIFVEGNSTDDTWETIVRLCQEYPGPHQVSYMKQDGRGKWDAVRKGFDSARGCVLVILDGDLAVRAEELHKFNVQAGEFLNGTRTVRPMEHAAMRAANVLGNKFFALALSVITRHRLTDSLCGTKALRRDDWARMQTTIPDLIHHDPFGDHALLMGAASLGLSIREIPVPYHARTYGSTNISRFSDGWKLLKLSIRGFLRVRLNRRVQHAR